MTEEQTPVISHKGHPSKYQGLLVPEIFEAILLQLPLQDLLVNAQRTCRDWYACIKTSARLQQALFFRAIPEIRPVGDLETPAYNPLLQKAFPPWYRNEQRYYDRGTVFTDLEWSQPDSRRDAFMRREATWRNMLPVQPPSHVFEVRHAQSNRGGTMRRSGRVYFTDGVRMGTLYDYAYISVAQPISSFAVRWNVLLDEHSHAHQPGWVGAQEWKDAVTMKVSHTAQCNRGMPPDVGNEFRSEAFEVLDVELKIE
jgi:hypothetical protein